MKKNNLKFFFVLFSVFFITLFTYSCAPKKPSVVKPKVEEEARLRTEEEKRKFEEERSRAAEEEARLRTEEEKRKAEEEAGLKAEEETRLKEEEEKRKIEEEARLRAEEEKRKFEEERRKAAEEEARLRAEEEKRKIEEEKLKAAAEIEVQPLKVKESDVRTIPEIQDIYFDFDKSDIRPDAKEILIKNAEWLQKNPDTKIQVEGHCDERGTSEYNLALGDKRALTIKKYLISLGISAERIYTISYGEELPIDANHNEEAWIKNRRGHFLIVK